MLSKKVRLELPKFELEFSSQLNSVLKKLGMNEPFNENTANFNGIKNNIYIDEVIQKTYLKVDEKGTKATAVTIIATPVGVSPTEIPKIYPMIVNRPFLFLLKNDKLPIKNEMLFMAKIESL